MATNVLLPQWGMNMEDGLLVKWLVKEGDAIEEGQALVEVETAKINSELESPATGVIAHLMFDEGATAKVGEIVVVIGEPGESVARPENTRQSSVSRRRPAEQNRPQRTSGTRTQVTPIARRLARDNDIDVDTLEGTGPNGRITEDDVRKAIEQKSVASVRVQIVPKARALAKEHDIDLDSIVGSGPNGRILVTDVERIIAEKSPANVREVVPLRGLRRTIADRMMLSATSMAQVTLTTEADVTELVALREALVSEWREHRVRPLDLDLIVKAVAETLAEHPRLNATLVNDEVRIMDSVNVGTAMAVPDGLVVPVISNADEKSALDIAREIRDLADKSRKNGLTVDDMTGATFTITSLANYDIDAFTPIIDPPQVAIIGVGRINEKPAVFEGQIAIRSMIFLSLAFDHRALDGVPAGEFLRALKGRLEDVSWMESSSPKSEA